MTELLVFWDSLILTLILWAVTYKQVRGYLRRLLITWRNRKR